jgi:putative intracellular protease/amidase
MKTTSLRSNNKISAGFFLLLIILLLPQVTFSADAGKILIILSNTTDMGDPEQHDARNNLWEYAPPYHVFISHGYQIDFASPKGGLVEFSMDPMGISSYAIKYEGFLDKANASLSPEQVNPAEYEAVYIGGGYGNLFDVGSDEKLLNVIAQVYESGGVVGGCGHGPGAFANVMLKSGQYMVKGKRVAGFPDATERSKSWAMEGKLLPYLVEDQLNKNGAIALNKSSLEDKHAVVIDQRLVSSMFLPSAALVAKEMIILLED